jgi:hypothetical protein
MSSTSRGDNSGGNQSILKTKSPITPSKSPRAHYESLFSPHHFWSEIRIISPVEWSSTESSSSLPIGSRHTRRNPHQVSATCRLCGVTFENHHEQRAHFRSEIHRSNLIRPPPPTQSIQDGLLSEGYQNTRPRDSIPIDASSSSSYIDSASLSDKSMNSNYCNDLDDYDSDSIDPEDHDNNEDTKEHHGMTTFHHCQTTHHDGRIETAGFQASSSPSSRHTPWIHWMDLSTGTTYYAWECIFSPDASLFRFQLQSFSLDPYISTIILFSGGNFAAAVFQQEHPIAHTSFHRYIARQKQGTIQSVHDQSTGHHAKSAGAQLRRYNEMALSHDISSLLDRWKSLHNIQQHSIFLHASSYNLRLLRDYDSTLFNPNTNSRLSKIPMTIRRSTFQEVCRIHNSLYSLWTYGPVSH